MKKGNLLLLLTILAFPLYGQLDSLKLNKKGKRKPTFYPLPALSYTPETQLTLGAALVSYFDLYKPETDTRLSNIQVLAVYTTAKQILLDTKWFLYTKNEDFIFFGRAFYHKYPDRHYGYGNTTLDLVNYFEPNNASSETFNYLAFNTQRVHFSPVFLRKIYKRLYGGIQFEYEQLFDFKLIDQRPAFIDPDILSVPVTGARTGLGFNITFDNRDINLNPLNGHYLQLQNWFFSEKLGGDYQYSVFRFDGRSYINTLKDQTIALQLIVDQRYSPDGRQGIPFRGLARFGGADLVKGYFYGTYQAQKMTMFQMEYRWPIYYFKKPFPFKKLPIIKGFGLVGFLGGGQVFDQWSEFGFNRFRLAMGGGFRINIDREQRLNIGADFGYGFDKNSDFRKHQTGIYFFLGETF